MTTSPSYIRPTNDKLVQALKLIEQSKSRPSVKLIDAVYGPRSAQLRADVATILLGHKVTKSAKESQWGRFRELLFNLTGATGDCLASQEADLESKAKTLLTSNAFDTVKRYV